VSISETVSKKPRRGRPRSFARVFLDDLGPTLDARGKTLRTHLSHVYKAATYGNVDRLLNPDDQRVFLGGSSQEILESRAGPTPRGFHTFAVEFGRWSVQVDEDTIREHLVDVAAHIRTGQVTFTRAAAHYRRNRVGKRAGNEKALARHLARALDEYLLRFPMTTAEVIERAIVRLTYADREVRGGSS
jgi:hypothetical protein